MIVDVIIPAYNEAAAIAEVIQRVKDVNSLPLEKEIIPLLSDRDAAVKTAAHQALVRLSRGTDLGPAANASGQNITKAQQAWRQWLDKQIPMPPQAELQKKEG